MLFLQYTPNLFEPTLRASRAVKASHTHSIIFKYISMAVGQDQELESSVNKFANTARHQASASTQVILQDQQQDESLRNYVMVCSASALFVFVFVSCCAFPPPFPSPASSQVCACGRRLPLAAERQT